MFLAYSTLFRMLKYDMASSGLCQKILTAIAELDELPSMPRKVIVDLLRHLPNIILLQHNELRDQAIEVFTKVSQFCLAEKNQDEYLDFAACERIIHMTVYI